MGKFYIVYFFTFFFRQHYTFIRFKYVGVGEGGRFCEGFVEVREKSGFGQRGGVGGERREIWWWYGHG